MTTGSPGGHADAAGPPAARKRSPASRPTRVALSRDEMRERRGRNHGVAKFGDGPGAEIHRSAGDRARSPTPCSSSRGTAWLSATRSVRATSFQSTLASDRRRDGSGVLAELGAVAVERAAMQAGHESLDDDARATSSQDSGRRCARLRKLRLQPRESARRGEKQSATHAKVLPQLRAGGRRSDRRRCRRPPPGNSAGCDAAAPAAPRLGCPPATRRCVR